MRDCVWGVVFDCLIDNPILTGEVFSLKATLQSPSEHVHTYIHEHTHDQFGHGGVGGCFRSTGWVKSEALVA